MFTICQSKRPYTSTIYVGPNHVPWPWPRICICDTSLISWNRWWLMATLPPYADCNFGLMCFIFCMILIGSARLQARRTKVAFCKSRSNHLLTVLGWRRVIMILGDKNPRLQSHRIDNEDRKGLVASRGRHDAKEGAWSSISRSLKETTAFHPLIRQNL